MYLGLLIVYNSKYHEIFIDHQAYRIPETNNNAEYPPNQPEQYKYEEVDNSEMQKQTIDPCVNYVEEFSAQPTRKPNFDLYTQMERSMVDKKRELMKLKEERQRMLEEGRGNFETAAERGNEDYYMNLSEVPENMRGQTLQRENNFEKEKKMKQQEFERYQPYPPQMHPGYQSGFPVSIILKIMYWSVCEDKCYLEYYSLGIFRVPYFFYSLF